MLIRFSLFFLLATLAVPPFTLGQDVSNDSTEQLAAIDSVPLSDVFIEGLDSLHAAYYTEEDSRFGIVATSQLIEPGHEFHRYDPALNEKEIRRTLGPKGGHLSAYQLSLEPYQAIFTGWESNATLAFDPQKAKYIVSDRPLLEASFFRSSKNADDELGYRVLHGQKIGHQWYYTAGLERIGANGFYTSQTSFSNAFFFRSSFQGAGDRNRIFLSARGARQNQDLNGGLQNGNEQNGSLVRTQELVNLSSSSGDHRNLNLHLSHYWNTNSSKDHELFHAAAYKRHRYRYEEDNVDTSYFSQSFATEGAAKDSTTLIDLAYAVGIQNKTDAKHAYKYRLSYHNVSWESTSENIFESSFIQIRTLDPRTNQAPLSDKSAPHSDPGFSDYSTNIYDIQRTDFEDEISISGTSVYPGFQQREIRQSIGHLKAEHRYLISTQLESQALLNFALSDLKEWSYSISAEGGFKPDAKKPELLHLALNQSRRPIPLVFRQYGGIHSRWINPELDQASEFKLNLILGRKPINLSFQFSNTRNKYYLDSISIPANFDKDFRALSIKLAHDYRFWDRLGFQGLHKLNLSSDLDFFGLPAIISYTNIYLFQQSKRGYKIFLGSELVYLSRHRRAKYNPSLDLLQIPDATEISKEFSPRLNPYLSLKVSDVSIMIKFENASQGLWSDRDFMVSSYALNDRVLRFGVKWLFFD